MTQQLVLIAVWLVSGFSGLGLGLAAVGLAKRRLAEHPVAEPDALAG